MDEWMKVLECRKGKEIGAENDLLGGVERVCDTICAGEKIGGRVLLIIPPIMDRFTGRDQV